MIIGILLTAARFVACVIAYLLLVFIAARYWLLERKERWLTTGPSARSRA